MATKEKPASPVFTHEGIRDSITAALKVITPDAERRVKTTMNTTYSVHGEPVKVLIDQHTTGSWHFTPTGRWQVTVQHDLHYSDRKRFIAQTKDFDYQEIAAEIVRQAERAIRLRKERDEHKQSCVAFAATTEHAVLEALGVNLSGKEDHYGAAILRKLSPAALSELAAACGVRKGVSE